MSRLWIARAGVLALAGFLWWMTPPQGLTAQAWHLFALFAGAIAAVVTGALPILTASLLAAALAVLTKTLRPEAAFGGFSNGTILLIVVAFLVARAVVSSGLGQRIGYAVVGLFGSSTLGLSYSLFLVDAVIAPAFPSNTARSGVLYPLAYSLAEAAGAEPAGPTRRRLGAFIMFSGIASLSLSSGLWLTAMAANPVGAEIAKPLGVSIGFGSWLLAAALPTLVALICLPPLLFVIFRPEIRATPEAPAAAKKALSAMGALSAHEKIVAVTFLGMVLLWAAGGTLGVDPTAVAFAGLATLLATGVLTPAEIAQSGDVLAIYLWFAILFTLSSQLSELGFMGFLGQRLASHLGGLAPGVAGVVLVVAYVVLHYLFVSQTAHLLALFGVFLDVGVRLGVPAAPLAFLLLFATNFFSSLTPQASSANLLFAGSGFLSQGEMYRAGAVTTGFCLAVFLVVGIPWLMWVTR